MQTAGVRCAGQAPKKMHRAGGRGKVCVNDKIREYEKVRLSQEWKQEPIQEGVEEK